MSSKTSSKRVARRSRNGKASPKTKGGKSSFKPYYAPPKIFGMEYDEKYNEEFYRSVDFSWRRVTELGSRSILHNGFADSPPRFLVKSGQLKLWAHLKCLIVDCLPTTVLYVGSAPGYNIIDIARQFPDIAFVLYDPKPLGVSGCCVPSNITFRQREFSDSDASRFSYSGRLLFVDDSRSGQYRNWIRRDFDRSVHWLKMLQPECFSIKCDLSVELPDKVPAGVFAGQECTSHTSNEVRLVCYGWHGTMMEVPPNLREGLNGWKWSLASKPWLLPDNKEEVRSRLSALGAPGLYRRSSPNLSSTHPYLSLELGERGDPYNSPAVLNQSQIDKIEQLCGGSRPKRVSSPVISPHPVAKYFRDNSRYWIAERLRGQGKVVAFGGNALKLKNLGLDLHVCSPPLTDKDRLKHKVWDRQGIKYCKCSVRDFLSGGCDCCRAIAESPGRVTAMLVDVVYYLQDDFDDLLAVVDSIVSYHHEFEGDSGQLFDCGQGPEVKWLRRGKEIHFNAKGESHTHVHSDLSWLSPEKYSFQIWNSFGEGGSIFQYCGFRSQKKSGAIREYGRKERESIVSEAKEEAKKYVLNSRVPSVRSAGARNSLAKSLAERGIKVDCAELATLGQQVVDEADTLRYSLVQKEALAVSRGQVFEKARRGEQIGYEEVKSVALKEPRHAEHLSKLTWGRVDFAWHESSLRIVGLVMTVVFLLWSFSHQSFIGIPSKDLAWSDLPTSALVGQVSVACIGKLANLLFSHPFFSILFIIVGWVHVMS